MGLIDWIANYWMYIAGGGVVLLLAAWLINVIFRTFWGEWKHEIDTKRREPQKWKRDPFNRLR